MCQAQPRGYDQHMSEARPLMTRVSPALVVACVWVLSTLYLFIAQALRLKRLWSGAPAPDPLLSNHRQLTALLIAAALVLLGCRLLARRPASAMTTLVVSVLVENYDLHTSAIAPDQYLPVCTALFFIAAGASRRAALPSAALAFAGVTGYVAVSLSRGLRVDTPVEAVVLLITMLAWVLGDARRAERAHAEQLRAQAAGQAVTAERLRIARELHDMVAHEIGVVALQAGAAKLVVKRRPDAAEHALGIIEDTSRATLAGLRRMVGALHEAPALQPDAPGARDTDPANAIGVDLLAANARTTADNQADAPTGLGGVERLPPNARTAGDRADAPTGLNGIDRLVANARTAGVRVDVQWRGERRVLPPEVDLSVFRVVQESVTNVIKHSGTRQCRVSVAFGAEEVAVAIVDSGTGGGGGGGGGGAGYGLAGMRTRIEILHGEFSAGPRPEGGFRVSARVPVPLEA
jgi:signal transduction histidine kinase